MGLHPQPHNRPEGAQEQEKSSFSRELDENPCDVILLARDAQSFLGFHLVPRSSAAKLINLATDGTFTGTDWLSGRCWWRRVRAGTKAVGLLVTAFIRTGRPSTCRTPLRLSASRRDGNCKRAEFLRKARPAGGVQRSPITGGAAVTFERR